MRSPEKSETDFAERLFNYTAALAAKNSNAVLAIVSEYLPIVEGVTYPPGELMFGGGAWRAYYHCHPSPHSVPNEHGHFHLFHRLRDNSAEDWGHVVCLSMDTLGQPLRWVLVNRWVTGGRWLEQRELQNSLLTLPTNEATQSSALSIVEDWLLALLGFYRQEITALYVERDRYLNNLTQAHLLTDIENDRAIYGLAVCDIDLRKKVLQLAT